MFIQWLEFKNKTTGQEITHVDFDQINLLVGFSGAGKTQILRTITDFFHLYVTTTAILFLCIFLSFLREISFLHVH